MLIRRYYPDEGGEVRVYLEALRRDGRTRKAAVKLLRGWEPLWELKRLYDKTAYRVFFCVKGRELWLLSAYEKGSEKTPRSELERAYRRMREVLA